jgi:hypothetical protein
MVPGDDRLVENQQRFRRANERLQACVSGRVTEELPIPFICECADDSCLEPVRLTLPEYDDVRDDDARFMIVNGHATVAGEDVVEVREGYAVVEKSTVQNGAS